MKKSTFLIIIGIIVILIGSGFFVWQKFGVEKRVFDKVILSLDSKIILGEKNGKQTEIYSIRQWQEFAMKNQDLPALKSWPHPTATDVEITYKDYTSFHSSHLSPDKNRIAFAVGKVGGGAWGTHSIIGILDLQTKKVDLLIRETELRQIIWSPDAKYILYFTVSDYTGGGTLVVYDSTTKEKMFELKDDDIAQALGIKAGKSSRFFSEFRNVKWSLDTEKIYFSTNSNTSGALDLSSVDWTIDRDGTDLRKIDEDETANWQTYTNTQYGFEIKYPSNWKVAENLFALKPSLVFCPAYLATDPDPEVICKLKTDATKPQYEDGMIYLFHYNKNVSKPNNPAYRFLGLDFQGNHYYLRPAGNNESILNQMLSTFKFTDETAN